MGKIPTWLTEKPALLRRVLISWAEGRVYIGTKPTGEGESQTSSDHFESSNTTVSRTTTWLELLISWWVTAIWLFNLHLLNIVCTILTLSLRVKIVSWFDNFFDSKSAIVKRLQLYIWVNQCLPVSNAKQSDFSSWILMWVCGWLLSSSNSDAWKNNVRTTQRVFLSPQNNALPTKRWNIRSRPTTNSQIALEDKEEQSRRMEQSRRVHLKRTESSVHHNPGREIETMRTKESGKQYS